MNFIVKLSSFKNSVTELFWDNIFIVIDKMIKYTYFIFINEEINLSTLITILLWYMFVQHELSKEIIIDRDLKFILNFW